MTKRNLIKKIIINFLIGKIKQTVSGLNWVVNYVVTNYRLYKEEDVNKTLPGYMYDHSKSLNLLQLTSSYYQVSYKTLFCTYHIRKTYNNIIFFQSLLNVMYTIIEWFIHVYTHKPEKINIINLIPVA